MPLDNSLLDVLRLWKTSPLAFVTQALKVTPEPWQAEVLKEIEAGKLRLAIRSGHGVGKSALLSWIILWFVCTRKPCKAGCTAPTEHQLSDILWSELAMWWKRLPDGLRNEFNWTAERFSRKADPEEGFAVARVARKEKPEAFQGLHSENMLLIGDEASGIDDVIYEAGIGALSTPGAIVILAGNPTRPSGFFFDCFHKMRERWTTRRVSSDQVDRAKGHIDEVVARFGRDSNAYRVRVQGEFPTTADEQVIPLDLIEAAIARDIEPPDDRRVVWGVDVARFGDDRSALAKRRGNVLLEPVKWWRQKDTMQSASIVFDEYRGTDEIDLPSEILVDVVGLGAGTLDRLVQLGLPARGINVGEAPSANERYMRLRDELWFRGREWFQARDCKIPDDPGLIAELVAPTYTFTATEKIVVERKQDLKDRGMPSPDLADAFLLTLCGGWDRVPKEELMHRRYGRRRERERSWMSV